MNKKLLASVVTAAMLIPTVVQAEFSMDQFFVEDSGGVNEYDKFDWGKENGTTDNNTNHKEELDGEEVVDTQVSKHTIQFTIDNSAKFPVYIDTGIRFTNTISQQTVREILTQISIKSDGRTLEDTGRMIALVNGTLVEVKNRDYLFEEFVQIFEGTRVSIIQQDSRKNNQFNLADYLETYKQTPLIVNGKKIELFNEPVIENSKVLLPVREVVEGLGAKITSSHDENNKISAYIKKGENIIIVHEGSNMIKINNKNIDTGAVARVVVAKDGERFFANMEDIVKALGGEMYWDAQRKSIVIE